MEARGNKRRRLESSEVEPGNDNGPSRREQSAYPSEQ